MSLSNKLSISDLDLKDKRVLIRVDFDVPIEYEEVTNPAVSAIGVLPASFLSTIL